jgi:hypothetical protein
LALAAVIATIACLGVMELARRSWGFGPAVGDIISFSPQRPVARDLAVRLVAQRAGQSGCVLDVTAMRATGGSLIVEARETGRNPFYHVHWSGLRTSADADNCGAAADLDLRGNDLELLIQSTVAVGSTQRQIPMPGLLANAGIAGR